MRVSAQSDLLVPKQSCSAVLAFARGGIDVGLQGFMRDRSGIARLPRLRAACAAFLATRLACRLAQ